MGKNRHSFDVSVSFIVRVQAEDDEEALELAHDAVNLPDEFKTGSLQLDIDDEDTSDEEPEYNPEDDPYWDETEKERSERYAKEDSYDYVQDDLNFDSNRERNS